MAKLQAIGIDLGTTYSCLACLNEHGEPESIPNAEGEITTPSVVLFEHGEVIVGTEALRSSIINPTHVVQHAKRHMGDPRKKWVIEGKSYGPIDISAFILKKLIADAESRIGKIDRAVITVPAQFSDQQREDTIQAGRLAGLNSVDLINEPVAAALCYVLGEEGLWFSELTEQQCILVYDLGGGTFDLSLVQYKKDEVRVIASSGDLHLGGIDWNQALLNAVADQFAREFRTDPRTDPESLQALSWEVELCKRGLSVRPRAALVVQHDGKRKAYQIEQGQFGKLTEALVKRTEDLTVQLLRSQKMGWAHVNAVLSTGGSSRMPMVRDMLQRVSGRTLNTSLSPDQSIAHGAAYYAGMVLSNSPFVNSILSEKATARLKAVKQHSVNARALGVLVRDVEKNRRLPYYLLPANSALPASATHEFGTCIANQRRVNLRIVESGTAADPNSFVEIGTCVIDDLPPNLPVDSLIAVTISYDASARIQVAARDVVSGRQATTVIVREQSVVKVDAIPGSDANELHVLANETVPTSIPTKPSLSAPRSSTVPGSGNRPGEGTVPGSSNVSGAISQSMIPVLLCNECGEPLDAAGDCPICIAAANLPPLLDEHVPPQPAVRSPAPMVRSAPAIPTPGKPTAIPAVPPPVRPAVSPSARPLTSGPVSAESPAPRPQAIPPKPPVPASKAPLPVNDSAIMELPAARKPGVRPAPPPVPPAKPVAGAKPAAPAKKPTTGKGGPKPQTRDSGEDEFWKFIHHD
jgi:molecular chaperone DnaK